MIPNPKIQSPHLRRPLLRRADVLALVDGALDHRLTVVSAPAGFGKSTLLAQWGEALTQDRRGGLGWLSVDPMLDSGRSFLQHLVRALAQALGPAGDALAELTRAEDIRRPAALSMLVTAVARQAGPVVLVIDDLHRLTSAEARLLLQDLVDHAPANLHLVLLSRGETGLHLAALRARGEVLRLSERHLRLTLDEAQAFLRDCHGVQLADADLKALHLRTEGWVAALQLAGLSIRDNPDSARAIAAFSGPSGDIAAYLAQDVLGRLPPDLLEFLRRTAHLEWFDADLAAAVTGHDDAAGMIARIEAADLFLIVLAPGSGIYRYHHLFAEQLRALPQPAGEVRRLHLRAAARLTGRGLEIDAVHHALAAGETAHAADLVEACCMTAVQLGHITRLRAWLERLPPAVQADRPRLLLARAWVYFHSSAPRLALGAVRDARDLIARLWHEGRIDARQHAALTAEMRLLGVGAVSAADRSARARRMALALMPDLPRQAHFLRGTLSNILAFCEYSLGHLGPARLACAQGRVAHEAAGAIFGMAYSDLILGLVEKAAGNLHAARALFAGAAGMAREALGPGSYTEAMAAVFQAELAYERDELAEADRLLADHRAEMEAFGLVVHEMTVRLSAARLAAAHGDRAGALALLSAAAHSGARNNYRRLVAAALNDHVRLLLLAGDGARARGLLAARGLGEDSGECAGAPSSAHEMEQLALARVLIAEGAPAEAHRRLHRIVDRLRYSGHLRRLVQVQAVNARAAYLAGERIAALNALSEAMDTALRQGAARSLLDEGPPLAEVLDWARPRIPAWQRDLALAEFVAGIRARLLPGAAPGAGAGAGAGQRAARAALSPKETEVARALLNGATNREISERLGVSLDTTKWHLKNIFAKLSVTNRTQAVLTLSEMGGI